MRSRWARWAAHRVDLAHAAAAAKPDPVAYLRECQAEAEYRYLATGNRRDLALVRAFATSLDGAEAQS